jgi:uncharacterized protein YkwD
VLSRYFSERGPVVTAEGEWEGAVRLPEHPPIQVRSRAWWDEQVRWGESRPAVERARRPPPPPARPAGATPPPPAPPPARATAPVRITTVPAGSSDAAAAGGSVRLPAEVAPRAEPTARRPRRFPLATLTVVFVLAAATGFLLMPEPVRNASQDASQETRQPGGAPDTSASEPPQGEGGGGGSPEIVKRGAGLKLVSLINRARADEARAELQIDEDLSTVADIHVEEMIGRGRLYHTATDVLGRRVTNWGVLAESIGVGPNVESLFDALMGSEADRRNLLDPSFRHIGVGASRRGDRLWVTVLFSDEGDPGTIL